MRDIPCFDSRHACHMFALQPAAGPIVKNEPAMVAMKEYERVLLDAGSCPKAQIKGAIDGKAVGMPAPIDPAIARAPICDNRCERRQRRAAA